MTQTKKRVVRRFNWRKFALFSASTLLLVALATGAGFYAFLGSLRAPGNGQVVGRDLPEPTRHEPINVLILGLDVGVVENPNSGAPGRSDTMIVATLDPEKKQAGVLSIPRDSRVLIPGRGTDKINHAHVFGGTDLAIRTVENLLNIPIHYYVKINYEGLRNLVDTLGGVHIDVEKDMKYTDRAGGLYIDIKAGPQVLLDGAKAEEFLRYRDRATGDIGRIERQQQFIKALAQEIFSASTILKIPELARVISDNVETNMTPAQIVFYANAARSVDLSQVPIETLVGTDCYIDDISYWIVDEANVGEQVARVLLGIDREANKVVTLEVLNGSGSPGAASEIARQLESMGYTIGTVGNASNFDYRSSAIIYSHDTPFETVETVAKSLNITRLIQAPEQEERKADITVIVGRDLVG
ncbi:MAG: LCP family protein [Firmicutes bacterium]|nr:LCP family protein [Bacillota bacterium]